MFALVHPGAQIHIIRLRPVKGHTLCHNPMTTLVDSQSNMSHNAKQTCTQTYIHADRRTKVAILATKYVPADGRTKVAILATKTYQGCKTERQSPNFGVSVGEGEVPVDVVVSLKCHTGRC